LQGVARIVYVPAATGPGVAELASLATVLGAVAAAALSGGASWESVAVTASASVILTLGLYGFSRLLARGARERLRKLIVGVAGDELLLSGSYPARRGRLTLQDTYPPRARFEGMGSPFSASRLKLSSEPCSIAAAGGRLRELHLPAYLLETRHGRVVVAYANPPPARPNPDTLALQAGDAAVVVSLHSAEDGGVQGHVTLVSTADYRVKVALEKSGARATVYQGVGSGQLDYRPLREPLVIVGFEGDIARASRLAEALGRLVACTGSYKLTITLQRGLRSWTSSFTVDVKPAG
jgi:hypothetical protein